jgi:hypothetical protein
MFFHTIVQGVWAGPEEQVRQVITDIMCQALGIN